MTRIADVSMPAHASNPNPTGLECGSVSLTYQIGVTVTTKITMANKIRRIARFPPKPHNHAGEAERQGRPPDHAS